MKKTIFMAMAALAMSMSVHAIRAVHELFPQRQSDGTTVMLYTNGDGHLAFYSTADDHVVIRNAEGTLCYAALKDGKLVATGVKVHNLGERTVEEKAFLASNQLKATDKALVPLLAKHNDETAARNLHRYISPSTADGLGAYGQSALGSIPSVGNITLPVIMVEFSDKKFQDAMTVDKFSRFMNEEGYHEDSEEQVGSVRDYFVSQSRGMFTPQFDVVAKVSLNQPYSYYGAHSSSGSQDVRSMQLFQDAVKAAITQGVDFSKNEVKYVIPNVIILYAGYGEATGGDDNTVWPHERDLYYPYNSVGSYNFGSYFMGNELYGGSGNVVMGMGVMVHELSHALGLPDIYDVYYSYQNDSPMGSWSVMDNGAYCPSGTSYAPMGYNAYERSYMGWLNIRELSDAQEVVLGKQTDSDGEFAVMYRNPSDSKEYFIFENHAAGTWYNQKYGTGLLVTRYAYNQSVWKDNHVNITQDKKRAMVVTASGRSISSNAAETDLFGNGTNGKEGFTFLLGATADANIYKVLKNPDGTLTFNFNDRNIMTSYAVSNEDVYEKITDASSLATGDKVIFVSEADGVAMSVSQQSAGRGAVAVKFNDNKAYGNDYVLPLTLMKTPSGDWGFRTDGNAYLSAGNSGLKVVSKVDNSCLSSIAIADGNVSLLFNGTVKNRNMGYSIDNVNFTTFPDAQSNIQIYRKVAASGINSVKNDSESKNGRVFNLAGQQVGNDYKGIVIVNGKKVVRK